MIEEILIFLVTLSAFVVIGVGVSLLLYIAYRTLK